MKTKKISLILCLSFLIITSKGYSQENQNAFLKGYSYFNDHLYFDSLNKILDKHELDSLNHSYEFFVLFNVDTVGNTRDFEIIEIPGAEIPSGIKGYIQKFIKSTDRNWFPQIENKKKVISNELIYHVCLTKKDQSFNDRLKDSEPIVEYFFGNMKRNERVDSVSFPGRYKFMILSY